jgi:hypothetical protein
VRLEDPALRQRAHFGEPGLIVDRQAEGRIVELVRGGAEHRQRVGLEASQRRQ